MEQSNRKRSSFMMADILSDDSESKCEIQSIMNKEKFEERYEDDVFKDNLYDEPPSPESRKLRTTFSSEQVLVLEKKFMKKRYLSANERIELARKLKLSDNQVKTWYQNRRMKLKRQVKIQMQQYHEHLYYESLRQCYVQTERHNIINPCNHIHEKTPVRYFPGERKAGNFQMPSLHPPKLERCPCCR